MTETTITAAQDRLEAFAASLLPHTAKTGWQGDALLVSVNLTHWVLSRFTDAEILEVEALWPVLQERIRGDVATWKPKAGIR